MATSSSSQNPSEARGTKRKSDEDLVPLHNSPHRGRQPRNINNPNITPKRVPRQIPASSLSSSTLDLPSFSTPQKPKGSSTDSISNLLTPPSDISKRRRDEAITYIEAGFIVFDENGDIFRLLELESRHSANLARDYITLIHDVMETRLGKAVERSKGGGKAAQDYLDLWVNCMSFWTSSGRKKFEERSTYEPIRSYSLFVASMMKEQLSKLQTKNQEYRLVVPTTLQDFKPDDSDDGQRIDLGLTLLDIDSEVKPTEYRAKKDMSPDAIKGSVGQYYKFISVIIEVKGGSTQQDWLNAYAQLIEYSRRLYENQYNRRHVWGIVICGTQVRLCHLGPDKIIISKPMDVSKPDGRLKFTGILVKLSLCKEHQRGKDPTTRYLSEGDCFAMECPAVGTDGKYEPKTYYFRKCICKADHLFGRHTRCFEATTELPEAGVDFTPTVIIKDCWSYANEDLNAEDPRDEISTLRRIDEELSKIKDRDFLYPKLEDGGRVQFKQGNKYVEDNTANLYHGYSFGQESFEPPFRVHKRMAISPIGKSLSTINSIDELITVVGDAMKCHSAILEKCKILHRDISGGNILVVRGRDGVARGLLIDFDHAIDVDKEQGTSRPERTGTYPFMSLNNLMNNDVMRTALDDWESTMDVLCWWGTIGPEEQSRHGQDPSAVLPIAKWNDSVTSNVINTKKVHFGSADDFEVNITNHFNKGNKQVEYLAALVEMLRKTIFQNPKCGPECWGTNVGTLLISMPTIQEDSNDGDEEDKKLEDEVKAIRLRSKPKPKPKTEDVRSKKTPFHHRAENWKKITKRLEKVMNTFYQMALSGQRDNLNSITEDTGAAE